MRSDLSAFKGVLRIGVPSKRTLGDAEAIDDRAGVTASRRNIGEGYPAPGGVLRLQPLAWNHFSFEQEKDDCKILENMDLLPFLPPVFPEEHEWILEYEDTEIPVLWGRMKEEVCSRIEKSGLLQQENEPKRP
ncbi:hypothetical protein DPMN_110894 [Dreissena polymorpha]|uniref:Uncharacterized protein n=1 Tax=Dreissena polymorpha TaxID=45954 RepID=A0A9D4KCW3_DREPO|nr:hypothetical protein DPMN_110894 [Dreissena polymorpha]